MASLGLNFDPTRPAKIKNTNEVIPHLASLTVKAEDSPDDIISVLVLRPNPDKASKQIFFETDSTILSDSEAKDAILSLIKKNLKQFNLTQIVKIFSLMKNAHVSSKFKGRIKLGKNGANILQAKLSTIQDDSEYLLKQLKLVNEKLLKEHDEQSHKELLTNHKSLLDRYNYLKKDFFTALEYKHDKQDAKSTVVLALKHFGFKGDDNPANLNNLIKYFKDNEKNPNLKPAAYHGEKVKETIKITAEEANDTIRKEIQAQVTRLKILAPTDKSESDLVQVQGAKVEVKRIRELLDQLIKYRDEVIQFQEKPSKPVKLYEKSPILIDLLKEARRFVTFGSAMRAGEVATEELAAALDIKSKEDQSKLQKPPSIKIDKTSTAIKVGAPRAAEASSAKLEKVDQSKSSSAKAAINEPKNEAVQIEPNIPKPIQVASVVEAARVDEGPHIDRKYHLDEKIRKQEEQRLKSEKQAALAANTVPLSKPPAQPALKASSTNEANPATVPVSKASITQQTPAAATRSNKPTRPLPSPPQAPQKSGPPILPLHSRGKSVSMSQHTVSKSSLITYADYKKGCLEAEKMLLKNKEDATHNPMYQGVEIVQGFTKPKEGEAYIDEVVITSENLGSKPHKMVSKFIPAASSLDSTIDKSGAIKPEVKGEIEIRIDPNPDDKILFQAFEFHKNVQNLKLEPGCNEETILNLANAAKKAGWDIEVMKEGEEDEWVQESF